MRSFLPAVDTKTATAYSGDVAHVGSRRLLHLDLRDLCSELSSRTPEPGFDQQHRNRPRTGPTSDLPDARGL